MQVNVFVKKAASFGDTLLLTQRGVFIVERAAPGEAEGDSQWLATG